jgi:translocation and assembly module TamA
MPRAMPKILISLIFLLSMSGMAHADRCAVELNAPAEIRTMLESNMGIFPELQDESLSTLRFEYLTRLAEDEIRTLLMAEGYFSPTINIRLEGQIARIDVDPGAVFRITGIHIEFRGAILEDAAGQARKQSLVDAFGLKMGMPFRDAEWVKAKEALMQEARAERFPAAELVHSRAEVDPDARAVVLNLMIDSHAAYRFGALEIKGLNRLPERIVTAANRIEPGTDYREQALNDYQKRLQLSGYFRSAFVSIPVDLHGDTSNIPIEVNVVESLARRIGLGAGYSTDIGAGVEVRYEDNLTLVPGWRSRSSLKLYQREQSVQSELYLTPVLDGLAPRLDARLKNSEVQNDHTYSGMLGARLIRAGYESEWHVSAELYKERKALSGQAESDLISLPINFSWTRRMLDNPLFPRKGYSLNIQAGGAPEELISNSRFMRAYGKSNLFWPLGKQGTLLLKGELGAVETDNSRHVPDDYLFRAGGTQSVRGYAYGSLGVEQNGAIAPGQYLAVASMEYIHPVRDDWYAAIFYDAGNVVDRWQDFSWAQGYGFGVRWKSPLGSLNADLAYGEQSRTVRLHLSVGLSF